MGNLTIATIFVVLANVLMWFVSISMLTINPTGSVCFHTNGTIIGEQLGDDGTYYVMPGSDGTIDDLPSPSAIETDNEEISLFNNVLSWFKTVPGLKYVVNVVSAPYNILKCTNLPVNFIAGISALWYLITFLVLIAFIWGRE